MLNLGSHLEFWGCVVGAHQRGDCEDDDANQHENHHSLKAVDHITGRLPNVIGKLVFLWARLPASSSEPSKGLTAGP